MDHSFKVSLHIRGLLACRLKRRVKRMANSTAVISLHLGSKRACHPGGGRLGWIWNSWTIIKTRRVTRSKTPSEVSGISRGGGNACFFHATPRWRRIHYKSIRAKKAFSCSVSGGVNTRSKPRMWRETFKMCTDVCDGVCL